MSIIYKPATLENLNPVYALDLQREATDHLSSEVLIGLIKAQQVIIAKDGKQIVGFVAWADNGDHNVVLSLVVRSDYRRKKIGTNLLKFVTDLEDTTKVDVRESNLAAQLFLRANSFTCFDILKEQYDDSDDDCYSFVLYAGVKT